MNAARLPPVSERKFPFFRHLGDVRSRPRKNFDRRQLRTGPSIECDRAARCTVAALDLYRSEKEKCLVRQSTQVGPRLLDHHLARLNQRWPKAWRTSRAILVYGS